MSKLLQLYPNSLTQLHELPNTTRGVDRMVLANIAFYPSLGYNLLRNYVQGTKWAWYNRIDDSLVLGAMPFQSMKQELIAKENIGGVVCCTEEYELRAAPGAMRKEDWESAGVAFHAIPMTDFTGSTSRSEIHNAVEFMERVNGNGKSVYVHCKYIGVTESYLGVLLPGKNERIIRVVLKLCQNVFWFALRERTIEREPILRMAGRTRSATVATCYLMKKREWLPNVAFEFLKGGRHQVLLRNAHWRTVNEYRRFLDRSIVSSTSS